MSSISRSSSTRWFVPLPRNRFFTGREADLRALYENFHLPGDDTQARIQVICGAGGIGKTQIALEYAHRFHDYYTSVLWLRTETPETLLADLITLMDSLDLPDKAVREHRQILSAVKRWLNGQANCLLILDNVEELDIVRELLPTHCVNHVLLTTRQQRASVSGYRLNLQTWSTEEGMLFLLRRAGLLSGSSHLEIAADELRTQAAAICQELGGLPLALDQAGAYLEETGCTLMGYQQRFQERQILLLSRRGPESFAHPDPVTTTILLTVERVERQVPAAAELLRLCAFLASDAIPEELITKQSVEILGPVLYASATNPFAIDTIYATFNATSLVELNVHTRLLTMHRLVQMVIITHMDQEMQQQWVQRALLAVNRAFPVVSHEASSVDLSWSDQLLPHALLTLDWIDRFLPEVQQTAIAPEIADLLFKVSDYLVTRGYYQKAQPLLERCLSLREQTLGLADPSVAELLARLGYLFRVQGLHEGAEALLQRALAIYEQASLPTSSALIRILSNLAMLSLDRGQYEQAETLMKRVISIEEQSQRAEDSASSLNDLATIYRRQGRYEEARALLLHAVRLYERAFGSEHPTLVAVLNNLANFYTEQGRYAEAKLVYLRALHVSDKNQVSDASQVATVLLNLGEIYRKQAQYEEAEAYYQRAFSLWEQTVGAGHPLMAYALHGLALLRMDQGHEKEAEQFLHETIQIREQAYDEPHPDLAEVIHDLALLYCKQGRDEGAVPLLERALQIREQVLGPLDPAIATSLHHMGFLYAKQGRKEQARSCYQRALAQREQVLGKWHPETQVTRSNLKTLLIASDTTS
jgi:tetratricopeptide (TPR) repeat protein